MEIKSTKTTVEKSNRGYILDFGTIERNEKALTIVTILDVEVINLVGTCGCTSVQSDKENQYTINYKNTNYKHNIDKIVVLEYKDGDKKNKIELNIKGNVN